MTIFRKGVDVKTHQEIIACMEEKAVFLAAMDGSIFKQLPKQHFTEALFAEEVEFPGDYNHARICFAKKQSEQQAEISAKRRNEAEEKRKAWYEERRNEVMTTRSIRDMAFRDGSVTCYKVLASDMEYDDRTGSWDAIYSTYREDTAKIFFSKQEADEYYNELIGTKVTCSPIQVVLCVCDIDSKEVLEATSYDELMSVIGEYDFDYVHDYVVKPEYKSIEDAIIVEWMWDTYLGYAREFSMLRVGLPGETEEDLITGNEDKLYRKNCTLLMTADEIKDLEKFELQEYLENLLYCDEWKWRNVSCIAVEIEDIIEYLDI